MKPPKSVATKTVKTKSIRRKSVTAKSVRRKSVMAKSVRGKPAGKLRKSGARAHLAPVKSEPGDFIDALMTAGAEALGLSIDPAWRNAVTFHLRLVIDHARRVEEFPLPDDSEPAPVFHA